MLQRSSQPLLWAWWLRLFPAFPRSLQDANFHGKRPDLRKGIACGRKAVRGLANGVYIPFPPASFAMRIRPHPKAHTLRSLYPCSLGFTTTRPPLSKTCLFDASTPLWYRRSTPFLHSLIPFAGAYTALLPCATPLLKATSCEHPTSMYLLAQAETFYRSTNLDRRTRRLFRSSP